MAARWTGGWGNEFDQLGVEACRTARGLTCRMLGGGELGCPDKTSRTRLGGWFTGWFLFALDDRSPRDEACAGTGYTTNADLPVWKLGPTIVRSGPLGTIAGPARPQVTFLTHTLVRGRTLLVASLNCGRAARSSSQSPTQGQERDSPANSPPGDGPTSASNTARSNRAYSS
jgi:hypothetical protein